MACQDIGALLRAGRYDEAFECLLAGFQGKVFGLAFSMLGDRYAAEEAAHETFIRVWKALPRFRAESAAGTWIYAIARNVCLTALRPRAVRLLSLDDLHVRREAERAPFPAPDHSPDVAVLLAALPQRYRQVLTLFYLEQKSYEEVAAMLDLPLGTVKTWIHRARKELVSHCERSKLDVLSEI